MTNAQTINSWIARSRPNPNAKLRLFCLPYAGGAASTFSSWSTSLTSEVEICPIELPGHGYRIAERPLDRLEPLVEKLTHALLPYLDKPFAFFGHSMGGLVGFELTHKIRKHCNISPEHLFISGRHAPQVPGSKPPIHHLPEPKFINELGRLNGTPKAVLENVELMELFLPVLRADFAAIETHAYIPKPRLDCPITVLGGIQDFEIACNDLEPWREQTNGNFSMQMFQGDHFFINSNQSTLLQFLNRELNAMPNRINLR
ncbi:thioesterase II family protein [Pleurocapsa sp. PCC 7319]|uniref:thioesterase II family protein n=1 Tax=Pleurocapsa sp. PCC 7319 TaxID=118161 RepID=UPI00034DA27C|nr:thioesterase II family protein [Pleurocapsa sp. PCC 7319]